MRCSPSVAVLALLTVSCVFAFVACDGSGNGIGNGPGGNLPPVNTPPTVPNPNPDLTLLGGVNYSYNTTQGGTTFADPDGDVLAYSVVVAPFGSGLQVAGPTIFGVPSAAGVYTAITTASDGKGGIATDSFTITVPAPAAAATHPVPTLPVIAPKYADADVGLPFYYTNGTVLPEYGNVLQSDSTPAGNPITNAGALLGRILFYDKRLSINDGIACASCHEQARGFADVRDRSPGFVGALTGRHSPSLANVRYYQPRRAFWDESAADLEELALIPIQDPIEMGMSLATLVPKLQATSYYPSLFQAAYGSSNVTTDGIARAIAQFLRSMTNFNSKYDQALKTGTPTQAPNYANVLTPQEELGRQLFHGGVRVGQPSLPCSSCHGTAAVVSNQVRNNGLDVFNPFDDGAGGSRFKAPSLRNVEVSAPYMHDARFTTLRQVIDQYNSGIKAHSQLDVLLEDGLGQPLQFNLTEPEKQALEAFLKTLTDNTFLTDPKFANPFP